MYACHGSGGNQDWSIGKDGRVKHATMCLTADSNTESLSANSSIFPVKIKSCKNSPFQVNFSLIL